MLNAALLHCVLGAAWATIAKWELRAALALGTGQWASHAWGCWVLGGDSRESIPGETFVHALVKLWCVVAGQPRDGSPARASSVKLIGRHSQPVKNGAPRPQVRPQEGAREEGGVMASPRRRRDRIQRRRKRTGAEEKRAAGERGRERENEERFRGHHIRPRAPSVLARRQRRRPRTPQPRISVARPGALVGVLQAISPRGPATGTESPTPGWRLAAQSRGARGACGWRVRVGSYGPWRGTGGRRCAALPAEAGVTKGRKALQVTRRLAGFLQCNCGKVWATTPPDKDFPSGMMMN